MILLFIVLIGLSVASFIGSLSYRIPRNISIIKPPSFCPICKKRIKPYDLVPVFSFIFLRGRCRYCENRISLKYLMLELGLPLIYVTLYMRIGLGVSLYAYCYLVSVLVYLSIVDAESGLIRGRDVLSVWLGGGFLLFLSFLGKLPYTASHYLYGALGASVLVAVSFVITYLIKRRMPMGKGDLLVIPGASLYFGGFEAIRILIFSSIIGVILGMTLIICKKVEKNYSFPMMPFFAGGVLIEILLF